jgi:hypothetical protein
MTAMNPLALDPLSPIGHAYRATGLLAFDPLSPSTQAKGMT